MSVLLFLYLAGTQPRDVSICLLYFSALHDSIMHDVCIYICLHVCGWLCILCDGLSWLCERPSLTTSTHDLVVWVCAQGICSRCIFMLYCVHSHRCVIVPIHVTWVTLVSPCMWRVLIPYFFCLQFTYRTPKNPKISFSLHGVARTSKMTWCN